MPVKLPPSEIAPVRDAIIGTFINRAQLCEALAPILNALEPPDSAPLRLAPGGAYRDSAFTLAQTWNGRGLMADLIGGLRRAAPHSPDLMQIDRERLVTASAAVETAELQGFVQAGIGYLPAVFWIDSLRKRMGGVCRIEFAGADPPGVGTGFLVGDDLVLTAYHVVELLTQHPLLAENAVCRFGCLNDTDMAGTPVALRRPRFIERESWPGGIELAPGGAEPLPHELDFALLRLKQSVPTEPFRVAAAAPAPNHPLVVLQHPRRAPLRISLGRVTGMNAGATRIRHNAATERGSSGAPCLNQDLDLVGLHNAARYPLAGALADYNTAVPMLLVAPALAGKGFALSTPAREEMAK